MNKYGKILLAAMLIFNLAAIVSSCKRGPAEKLGQDIDNGVQNTKDAVRDAADDLKKKR